MGCREPSRQSKDIMSSETRLLSFPLKSPVMYSKLLKMGQENKLAMSSVICSGITRQRLQEASKLLDKRMCLSSESLAKL